MLHYFRVKKVYKRPPSADLPKLSIRLSHEDQRRLKIYAAANGVTIQSLLLAYIQQLLAGR
jgi:predicted DNA binding CopG/RHH family protein